MDVRKMRQVACGIVGVVALSVPAFAQQQAAAAPSGGGLDLVDMFSQMGPLAWGVALTSFDVLIILFLQHRG